MPKNNALSKQTPHKSADQYRQTREPALIHVADQWLAWDESGAYLEIEQDTMESDVQKFLESAKRTTAEESDKGIRLTKETSFNPKKADVAEVLAALKHQCHRDATNYTPPCWLDDRDGPDPRNIIACKNGLLDVTTGGLSPLTPDFFTRTALPIVYDPWPAQPEGFPKFLREITDNRQELIDIIQEMFGYLVSADNEQEVVFYLVGQSRGGKGTLMKLIRALVGERNVEATPIESFADKHWAVPLMGASVALITDMNVSDRSKLAFAASNINMLSGRDPLKIRPMYEVGYTRMLRTRVVMASDSLPNFGEPAKALANRLLVIPFDVSFAGREDSGLASRLIEQELPAILAWSLEGLARLRERGRFMEPELSKVWKRKLTRLANPVAAFVEDCCVIDPAAVTPKAALFIAYLTWCSTNGARYTLTREAFGLQLGETFPYDIREARPRHGDGDKRVKSYSGIRLTGVADVVSDPIPPDFETELDFLLAEGLDPVSAIQRAREAIKRTVQ
jgi:putative DNA primase/helicase